MMLNDIQPFLCAARIFGCTPHEIVGRKFIITKWGIIYALLVSFFFLYSFGYKMYISFYLKDLSTALVVGAIRSALCYFCLFADGIITMIGNGRLGSAFENLHEFDVAAKFEEKNNPAMVFYCRFVLVTVISFWIASGFLSHIHAGHDNFIYRIFYSLCYVGVSIQILKFCGIMLLLYRRFNHLHQLIMSNEPMGSKFTMTVESGPGSLTLREVWFYHFRLTSVAEKINSIYSIQILLWITTMALNGVSRINGLTMGSDESASYVMREMLSTVACFINLFLIIISCHLTSNEANGVGRTVLSGHSSIQRTQNNSEDKIQAFIYFCSEKLRFTAAAGFIHIQLPLLMSIVGAVTTYLVILHTAE